MRGDPGNEMQVFREGPESPLTPATCGPGREMPAGDQRRALLNPSSGTLSPASRAVRSQGPATSRGPSPQGVWVAVSSLGECRGY